MYVLNLKNKRVFMKKREYSAIENDAALMLANLSEPKRARNSVGAMAVGSGSGGLTVLSGSSLNIQASPVPALTLEQARDKVRTLSEARSRALELKAVAAELMKKADSQRQALRELRNAVSDQVLKQVRINLNAQIKASTVAPKVLQASITTVSAVKPALAARPTKTNVVQRDVLAEYWQACDNKDYPKVAKIVSEQEKIRAFCRAAKQDVNSENAFHIVAKTNDLELFLGLTPNKILLATFSDRLEEV